MEAAAEGKERRLGDITVSGPRPVLHCSYQGEREREGEMERKREGRNKCKVPVGRQEVETRKEFAATTTCTAFPQHASSL